MTFQETKLPGVFEIHLQPKADERGFFARTWCEREFEAHGLDSKLVQCSFRSTGEPEPFVACIIRRSLMPKRSWCVAPEARYTMWCLILRPESHTYKEWIAVVLTADKRNMVYVPEGCAHGFLTLADETEVFYQMSEFYSPESARGVRWNDPAFQIVWPAAIEVISERDRTYPDFEQVQ